jgi:hypothetical protein
MCGGQKMKPLELTSEAKEKLWSELAQSDCDFVIFRTTCYLHTIEACVDVIVRESMDEFEHFVLKAIDILDCADIEKINGLLHIGRQIIQQITAKFNKAALLSVNADGVFEITDLGEKVLDAGEMIKLERKRHIFHFIDGSNEFLRIRNSGDRYLTDLASHETPTDWMFDVESLQKCISETDDWKKQWQFPMNIHELIIPSEEISVPDALISESALIVDKAQAIHCAILVKFSNDQPFELLAYPISSEGRLLGRNKNELFSLTDENSILRVFPYINDIPDNQASLAAFLSLGKKYNLSGIDSITVRSQRTHTITEVSNDSDISWAKLYWQNIKGNVFCDIISATATRMNKLVIESEKEGLQTVNLLFELNKSYLSENNLKDISTYKIWLSEKKHLTDEPIRNVASLAWEFGMYRLAYKLSELEDMIDANI